MITSMERLTALTVEKCKYVSDAGILSSLTGNHEHIISELNLINNDGISSNCIAQLIEQCKTLTSVAIYRNGPYPFTHSMYTQVSSASNITNFTFNPNRRQFRFSCYTYPFLVSLTVDAILLLIHDLDQFVSCEMHCLRFFKLINLSVKRIGLTFSFVQQLFRSHTRLELCYLQSCCIDSEFSKELNLFRNSNVGLQVHMDDCVVCE